MRRLLILTLVAALAASPSFAVARTEKAQTENSAAQDGRPVNPDIPPSLIAPLTSVQAHFAAYDYTGARADLQQIVDNPDFAKLPPAIRHGLLAALAWTDLMAGDAPAAYKHVTAAGPATGDASDGFYYYTRAVAADMTGHKDEALEITTEIPTAAPTVMPMLDMGYLLTVERYARGKGDHGAARRKLLEAFYDAGYTSPDPAAPAEALWIDLFETEVAAGNEARARALVATFTEPEDAIRLTIDKRYAAYLKDAPALTDFPSVVEASLKRARKYLEDNPRNLFAVRNLAYRLANANRLDEALTLADDTIARADAAPKDKPAFDDQASQLQWVYMVRSLVLARLGRRDDEAKAMEVARQSALSGGKASDDVSQPINLGDVYIAEGKPKEALDSVKNVDAHVSPYGRMAAMQVRACAYKQLGDAAKLNETMAYMKAHSDDGFMPYRGALECTGDADGLAAVLVARLDNPDTRNETLLWVQHFLTGPLTAYEKTLCEVETKAAAHPEVQAAIEKYGVVRSWPVFKTIGD
jgi:tetratricopeptide (TPR) repeat protein